MQKYLKYSVTGAWWLIDHQGVQTEKQNETEQERSMLRRRQKRWCHLKNYKKPSDYLAGG